MTDLTGLLEYLKPRVPHDPGEVILVGYTLEKKDSGKINQAILKFDLNVWESIQLTISAQKILKSEKFENVENTLKKPDQPTIALIQAYVYEGNVYKLPKPKLMVLDKNDGQLLPGDAAEGMPPMPMYWRVNKLERAIEVSVDTGLIEQLVLESNLPGKRSPNSYASNFQMANRTSR